MVEPEHSRDIAVVLRNVADADRGIDDDRPYRRDEDHEDRRWLAVAECRQRYRQPGERRDRAQDLEDRIEAAHRPDGLSDDGAEHDADDAGKAVADHHALQRDENAPTEPDILRTGDEKRIGDQVARFAPDLRR